ncbi:spore coat U domain-containing protein [Xylophilus sp. GOD-11R]|uniref:Csu type fimbrial protein n=1 Tax=Xylophilus sp. GOD-11R TaxID=3089814 RepID=UPI00298C8D92|nr:spore coat U domain-containing protein [Xylophilus sp. GOD-11R]WPB56884.1 spore coat U domain-containing protein [Xylophilus sp. GOD-11R]
MSDAIREKTGWTGGVRAALCGTALALVAAGGQTATLSGNLVASLTLTASCIVVGAPGSTGGINLGTLTFTSQPSTFTGTINAIPVAGVSGGGATQLLCSPDVSGLSISIDGGSNAGQGAAVGVGTRAMRNGTAFIPYEIFQDVGHTVAYPVGTALTTGFSIPANGAAINLPIFGQVNKTSASALPSGTYTDTLVVTLTF